MFKEKYPDGITIDELSDIHPSLYGSLTPENN